MTTKMLPCTCKHQFQDLAYGGGMRVHNVAKAGWSCTVCGATKHIAPDEKEAAYAASGKK